jgi:hypothetical protein
MSVYVLTGSQLTNQVQALENIPRAAFILLFGIELCTGYMMSVVTF